jgi:hypothetical protein
MSPVAPRTTAWCDRAASIGTEAGWPRAPTPAIPAHPASGPDGLATPGTPRRGPTRPVVVPPGAPAFAAGGACDHAPVSSPAVVPLWVRTVADPVFREALIADPLRALAAAPDVRASPEQVRQLEDLPPHERAELVRGVVREVHMRGGQARFGAIGEDGRLGGPP